MLCSRTYNGSCRKADPNQKHNALGCGQDELGIEHVVDKVELVFIVIIETFAVYMAEVANIVHAN